jgi:hypothetical protein
MTADHQGSYRDAAQGACLLFESLFDPAISAMQGHMAAYAACYSACGLAWAACYAEAGLIAGTIIAGPSAPAAALACNAAEAACMSACTLNPLNAAFAAFPFLLPVSIGGAAAAAAFAAGKYFKFAFFGL